MTEVCTDHRHRVYNMTCEQYADLKAFTAGLCNICGVKERYAARNFYIDHDHELGYWAVRGLLCPRCNTVIEMPGGLVGPEVEEYLSHPWHVRAGLVAPSEPTPRRITAWPRSAPAPVDPARIVCADCLKALGERFQTMRGSGRGLDLATRQFAKKELHPVIAEAKTHGFSVRDIARKTGYTPEHIYTIWRYSNA